MKKNDFTSNHTFQLSRKIKFFVLSFVLMSTGFIGKAQSLTGRNPYCIAANPVYTVSPPSVSYAKMQWMCSDPTVTIGGDPSPLAMSKVLLRNSASIPGGTTLQVKFLDSSDNVVAQSNLFVFDAAETPVTPSYYVTKTNDYCTSQYHIITLNVITNPNPSPNSNFSISPRIADPSVIITQTSKNIFELKLPLNEVPYFLYDISCTSFTSGCQSNSITSTSYSNSVSLNLTNCANNAPGLNYEITVAPNPYSNGYITITAPPVTQALPATCRIYNNSGVLKTTFSLTNSNTAFALKSTVGSSLIPGMYVVQVTYSNGIVKTKNLIVI